ncbi:MULTISPECIES: hypothetical protein [Halomonadaceae]|uniref:hypothetical protein n=1 Tax=Halomonadaceae TaxID=28256 RepID=UPI001CCC8080|nr:MULTISPECIES: hypothetical protein [Halomonadaceae]MBZ9558009.1 hypothetical protein [Modicisalibacter sp. R2A 31.J]MBZ9573323.1 hypothetical protein [Modicisalibacter sp. MOD 31.J]WIX33935.1 hypothetical protein QO259_04515 [Salinicola sp. JS01]
MCGLCGALGGDDHWSTHIEDPERAHHERRRARAYRARLINRVLGPSRLAVEDFQASSFVLATATGKREMVEDLGGVWRQAEQLSGRELDPLDAAFLASLG